MFPSIKLTKIHVSGVLNRNVLSQFGTASLYLAAMTTYYFKNPEEALKRVKVAAKQPGYHYGGITLPSGKKGWALYRDGREVERYAVMNG